MIPSLGDAPTPAALSCYTGGLAPYLETLGYDAVAVFGRQWGGSVVEDAAVPLGLHLAQLGRPIAGAACPRLVDVRGRTTDDLREFVEAARAEIAHAGGVVVCGDAALLPWTGAPGAPSRPHWFTLTDLAPTSGANLRVQVIDAFGRVLPDGRVQPFGGPARVEAAKLRRCASPSPIDAARARLGWGSPVEQPQGGTWSWFELVGTIAAPHAAVPLAPAPTGGLPAFAAATASACADRETYEHLDDVWIVTRSRVAATTTISVERCAGLTETVGLLRDVVVPVWRQLLAVMLYNRGAVERGRRPRPLEPAWADVVEAEGRLRDATAASCSPG